METIRSLIETVEKVGDAQLRHEMLGKVTEVQANLARTHEQLRVKQVEIDSMRAHLGNNGNHVRRRVGIAYDPPV